MNDFCDLLGTPNAPVSKIVSVKAALEYAIIYLKPPNENTADLWKHFIYLAKKAINFSGLARL